MVRITFPAVMQRHLTAPPVEVEGATVRQALDAAFALQPAVRGYLLDEQGALRAHIALFVDGRFVRDRNALDDPLTPSSQLVFLQALSGG